MDNVSYISRISTPNHQARVPLCALSSQASFVASPKILLVEDNALARHAEQLLLETLGCSVVAAGSGEEGLKIFNAQFNAVVLDIDLPGISGLTVAKTIRSKQLTLPLIACTGNTLIDAAGYKKAGFDFVLQKPMRLAEISCFLQQKFPGLCSVNDQQSKFSGIQ